MIGFHWNWSGVKSEFDIYFCCIYDFAQLPNRAAGVESGIPARELIGGLLIHTYLTQARIWALSKVMARYACLSHARCLGVQNLNEKNRHNTKLSIRFLNIACNRTK
jgi:hypothetical protein